MNARAVEAAAAELERKRRRGLEGGALGGLVAVAAGAGAAVSPRVALLLGVAATLQVSIAVYALLRRRALIGRLALEPAAYAIPEVERFGSRVSGEHERVRLAGWISSLVQEPEQPTAFTLPERVRQFARELESLARDFVSPSVRVQHASAVAARRLLTHPVSSPLYNPDLTTEDLAAALFRIRSGIDRGD